MKGRAGKVPAGTQEIVSPLCVHFDTAQVSIAEPKWCRNQNISGEKDCHIWSGTWNLSAWVKPHASATPTQRLLSPGCWQTLLATQWGQPYISQVFANVHKHVHKRSLTHKLSSTDYAWVGLEKPRGFSWAGMLGVLWHKQALPKLQGQHHFSLKSQAGGGRVAGSSVQRASSRCGRLVRARSSLCRKVAMILLKFMEKLWR